MEGSMLPLGTARNCQRKEQRRKRDENTRWWENRLRGTQEGAPGWNTRPWLSERILAMRHDPPKIAVGVAGGCRVKTHVT